MRVMALVGQRRYRSFPLLLAVAITVSGLAAVPPAGAGAVVEGTAAPVVHSFSVTPKKLSSRGGRVTLSAKVAGSRTCALSSKPALKGLPVVVPCGSGKFQRSVLLPADKSSKADSYTFTLSARGAGRVGHPARVTATVQGLKVSVTTTTTTVPTGTGGGALAVTGVSPDLGTTAGGESVTISGSGFTGVAAVDFGTVAATSFKVVSPAEITAVSPAETAGHVDVTVVTGSGTSPISTADEFIYYATGDPAIGTISPEFGPIMGGTLVQIDGVNLTGATSVDFGSVPAVFKVVSATEITATSPVVTSAGSVIVMVTTPVGSASAATPFSYAAVPSISAITPASGPPSGGTTVTITGTNLSGASAVDFGTQAVPFTVVSPTEITAVSPAGAVGAVTVKVTTPGGSTSAATPFSYVAAPTISAISPASGPIVGGETVTISGTNLTGATTVDFGSQQATFSVVSAGEITATCPPGTVGAVNVTVTTPGGTVTAPTQFTYVPNP
jgi:hypothetical protein